MKETMKEIEIYVPAMALQFGVMENISRHDRIRHAILRHHLTGSFEGLIEVKDLMPYVVLKDVKLAQERLGYIVHASINNV